MERRTLVYERSELLPMIITTFSATDYEEHQTLFVVITKFSKFFSFSGQFAKKRHGSLRQQTRQKCKPRHLQKRSQASKQNFCKQNFSYSVKHKVCCFYTSSSPLVQTSSRTVLRVLTGISRNRFSITNFIIPEWKPQ